MFDDYVLYLLESLHCQERANELMRAMKGEGAPGKIHFLFYIVASLHSHTAKARWNNNLQILDRDLWTFCSFSWITAAETGEELMLMGSTPTSTSPEPCSPAKSVHSAGVPAAGSPNSAQSPEYPGVPATAGKWCTTDPKLISYCHHWAYGQHFHQHCSHG